MHLLHLCLFAIASSLLPNANGFSPAASRQVSTPSTNIHLTPVLNEHYRQGAVVSAASTSSTCLRMAEDDKSAEIAALEEKLRQLKDEEGGSSAESASSSVPGVELTAEELADSQELEGESDDSLMFSERWKEAKDGYVEKQTENTMGGIAKAAAALGFIVFLGIFSQIPVGEQSLQRYQDVKGNPSRIDLGDLNPVD